MQGERQADDHEEQHRAEGLGDDEGIDGADLGITNQVGRALDVAAEHALAASAVDAQLLGATGDRIVVSLQLILGITRRDEPLHATGPCDVLDDGAEGDSGQDQQEHGQGQHGQVAQAAQGDGQGDRQGREGEGEIADGVYVVRQHRDQPMAAIALDLFDGGRQHLLAQRFAQGGNDVLAHSVATDVGKHRAGEGHQAKPGEAPDHALGQAGIVVQGPVDGGQQKGDAEAADHAQDDGKRDGVFKRLEQGEEVLHGAAGGLGHDVLLSRSADTGGGSSALCALLLGRC